MLSETNKRFPHLSAKNAAALIAVFGTPVETDTGGDENTHQFMESGLDRLMNAVRAEERSRAEEVITDLRSQRRHLAAKEQHWKAQATSMIAVLGRVQDEMPLRLRDWSHKRFCKWITWSTAWKFRDELFSEAAAYINSRGS